MILFDSDIRGLLTEGVIEGALDENVQPSSLDLRLGDDLKCLTHSNAPIDPFKKETHRVERVLLRDGAWVLRPGNLYLGFTIERVRLPDNVVARVDGKSSLARLGLEVHRTAGFIDPGFEGQITLEFTAVCPIRLQPGMNIAQIVFQRMPYSAVSPYGSDGLGSKYQNQSGPTESRYEQNRIPA